MSKLAISSCFENLCFNRDVNIFAQAIAPYLTRLRDLVALSKASKSWKRLIFSKAMKNIWGGDPVDVCIDGKCCFGCGRVQMASFELFSLIAQAPVEYMRMHLSFDELPTFLRAILRKGTMTRLHLRFRSDDVNYFRVLSELNKIQSSRTSGSISISHLTVFGWPSFVSGISETIDIVKTDLCARFFAIIGESLISVQLMESSPSGLLSIIRTHCPSLAYLSFEGSQPAQDINSLQFKSLRVLCLHNVGVRISGKWNLSLLERFEYIDNNICSLYSSCTASDIQALVNTIPAHIKELEIRFEKRLANELIASIATRFAQLESYTYHMAQTLLPNVEYRPLSRGSISQLSQACIHLTSIELIDDTIAFAPGAFECLAEFPSLQRIKLFYAEPIISPLLKVLGRSKSLEEVALLANAGDMFSESGSLESWYQIEDSLKQLSERFPSVIIRLGDCWWT
jgi:hypothetical protein